jgi:CTP:molybdopterin cytidylyltransferase MocA
MARIAALLLAAGRSERMGRCKQLLPLSGRPLIRHCLETLLAAGVDDIIVVLGAWGREIAPVIRDLPVTMVQNPDPASDMAGSVRAGFAALADDTGAVLVCLGDHPLVKPATVRAITGRHAQQADKIIIPVCRGSKGHPTLFPRAVIAEILTAPTLRDIVRKDSERVMLLPVDDQGVTVDIDTPEDWRRVVQNQLSADQQGQ